MGSRLQIVTAPAIEPVTLTEMKEHLRLDSGDIEDRLEESASIAPADHEVAANFGLVGTAIEVEGYNVLVTLVSGTVGSGGTIAAKIQESADNITWTDWTGGAFTTINAANDNATQEKRYTGTKRYIRVVATVAVATCEFGANVIKDSPTSAHDDMLTRMIVAARKKIESTIAWRAMITQSLALWMDEWPEGDTIELPRPPLLSVSPILYYGTDDTEYTMSALGYAVSIISEPGRVILKADATWPSTTLRPNDPIKIPYSAGYGAARTTVPEELRQAVLILAADYYLNPNAIVIGTITKNMGTVEDLALPFRPRW